MRLGNSISKNILAFYAKPTGDANHRYRSWEHCFRHFSLLTKVSHDQTDIAALHLAFYLASWGMYRGSSDLLWKDYKIHHKAVQILVHRRYTHLRHLEFSDPSQDADIADQILKLSKRLREVYRQEITSVDGKETDFKATDTLITKILLGTLGCAPACDLYFITGFRKYDQYPGFEKDFLYSTFRFCRQHRKELKCAQDKIWEQSRLRYPIMKLVDMYFWQRGH